MHLDLDELKEVCAQSTEQGFKAVKVKVGSPTLEEDIQRLETVRCGDWSRCHSYGGCQPDTHSV